MNFSEANAYLLSLGNEVLTMKFGLKTTEKLLAALGNPEKKYLKIQVAGTNGKGSTCAFLDAICRAANIETGLFTSPHLTKITERIKIGGREIGDENFAKHSTKIRELSEELVKKGELETIPTFFEQITAIAVSAFAEANIELAILETGLGGRFDSVTATRAEIAAIAPIDLDHQQFLGNTLAEIAAEKAAIIHKNSRAVISAQKPEVFQVIAGKCLEVGVTPVCATSDIRVEKHAPHSSDAIDLISFQTANELYSDVVLSLRGAHQRNNAALAVAVAETLREFDFEIPTEAIRRGLETAEHHGRLEFYQGTLFDGAHNIAGARALKDYLDEFVGQPITMIFGAMRDKDLEEIGALLFPKARNLIFTRAENPRSFAADELIKFLPANYDAKNVFQTANVEAALSLAKKKSGAETLICVTGSLYLVGEARKLLNNKSEI